MKRTLGGFEIEIRKITSSGVCYYRTSNGKRVGGPCGLRFDSMTQTEATNAKILAHWRKYQR